MNKNLFMGIIAIVFGVIAIPIQIHGILDNTKAFIPWPVLMVLSGIGMVFGIIAIVSEYKSK